MDINILKELTSIPSPSNNESLLVDYLEKMAKKLDTFQFYKTKKQSCIFSNIDKKRLDKPTILIDAHIDNVHLRVIRVTRDNYVVAMPVGFDSITLDGNSLVHMDSGALGSVVTMPPHLKISRKKHKKEVYIDFGFSKEDRLDILPGDIIMFAPEFYTMNNNYIVSNGLDNKASVFVLLHLLQFYNKHISKLNYNIIVNFSSREEIGYSSYIPNRELSNINIDEIIVLDTDFATDTSLISKDLVGTIELGKGPVITRNYEDDPILSDKLIKLASKHKIPYQVTYSSRFGASNNAYYTQFFDSYSQFIGIPLRNMHSPTEVVSIKDLSKTLELLIAYLST